ncbi:uncharacterized protein FOMMEDRAFT_160452 [Fomitiporia mediterranea MF3/22]|uniref:uncharacterized protein n=1 Tax=Fomitiporia mediterranea (strain MF3/22) TaxID=694068 RepID=UPI0004408D58|nr:uncharacterized protein FOMMEDRAFT_160452 [Fomitiporia mediterranea MF3/22]EJC99417.1 hypothetical protein FOMMEDRAFT_160452 [Fomitiporia mediterranea MF3/22]
MDCFSVSSTPEPHSTTPLRGTFAWDLEHMDYNIRWETKEEFDAWLRDEEFIVLGTYDPEHSHPIGRDNLKYTRLSGITRAHIFELLQLKVHPQEILRQLQDGVFDGPSAEINFDSVKRDHLVSMRDILRIKKELDAVSIHLHPNDGISLDF